MSGDADQSFPTRYPEDRPRAASIRSRVMLEVASELVSRGDFEPKQARVSFRRQGSPRWDMALFGSDALSAALEVADGETDFAIVNPATVIGRCIRGLPPFSEPVPVRAIATIPSYDQLGIAVRTDVLDDRSLEELINGHPALRMSLRGGRPDHSVHAVVDEMMSALGVSLETVSDWGGDVVYHEGIPHQEPRASAIRSGAVDVVIDEGIYNWVELAIDSGFRFVSIPEEALSRLESWGYRRSTIAAADYSTLADDVSTLDFSGFLVFTREDVPDDLVTAFCESLEARKDRIPWQGGSELPLERMVSDQPDAPVPIPFHPAADRYWRSLGYLG